MESKTSYAGLNFTKERPKVSKRWIPTLVVPLLFITIWILSSPNQPFFFVFIGLAVLTWIATHGWNEAYADFIQFLQRHQRF